MCRGTIGTLSLSFIVVAGMLVTATSCAQTTTADNRKNPAPAQSGATSDTQNTSALLLDFDSTGRIQGSYLIELKSREQLELARSGEVSPDTLALPTSRNALSTLASEIAGQAHGKVSHVTFDEKRMAFGIEGATDEAVKTIVAQDPRIASIAAVIRAGL